MINIKILKVGIDQSTLFSRSRGLNVAIDHISNMNDNNDNPIIFIVDASMILPNNLINKLQRNVQCGLTAYTPICTKVIINDEKQVITLNSSIKVKSYIDQSNPETYQVYSGYGMIGVCLNDLNNINGFDYETFGDKWGMEDNYLVQSLIRKGSLLIIRSLLADFYHVDYYKNHHGRKENKYDPNKLAVTPFFYKSDNHEYFIQSILKEIYNCQNNNCHFNVLNIEIARGYYQMPISLNYYRKKISYPMKAYYLISYTINDNDDIHFTIVENPYTTIIYEANEQKYPNYLNSIWFT